MKIQFKNYAQKLRILDLTTPKIMGILNVTPDSFSDGGRFLKLDDALFQTEQMLKDGADIIDIGGQSTRPGALEISVNEELDRVLPIIQAIRKNFDCLLSIDSFQPKVFIEAYKQGVDILNDVKALTEQNALEVAAKLQIPVCLMHMQCKPSTMQENPNYQNILEEIADFLNQRLVECSVYGIKPEMLILDPGFGVGKFGKTVEQNYFLLKNLEFFNSAKLPILVGLSRKSMLNAIVKQEPKDRLISSITANVIALTKGAKILRVHNVKETYQALQIFNATQNPEFIK